MGFGEAVRELAGIEWHQGIDHEMQEIFVRLVIPGQSLSYLEPTASLDFEFADLLCAFAFEAGMRIGELERRLRAETQRSRCAWDEEI